MMTEGALSREEVWLQDSEARLESMEILLKSVRRDIDALSEKLPSPRPGTQRTFRQEEPVVHESGSRDYVLRLDKRPKGYQNLGLGSHTTMEPFDDEEDIERPVNETPSQKSWRSPADFRPLDSPPDSPTFGESSKIISLNDIILPSDDTLPSSQGVEQTRVIPLLGSQHSLPTIEENSQEDNTDTSSISTAEDLKSADYSAPAVCGMASSDTIISPLHEELSRKTRSKCSLDEIMNSPQDHIKSAQSPLSRSRSQSPFIPLNSDSLRYSRTSLRSRDSTMSETDSFVTVNSQFFPSGEEAYVTACSDTEGLADSSDEGCVPSRRERTRKKMLVLQQNPSSECQNQSDDVLEFTLVEATVCKTPIPEMENPFLRKMGEFDEQLDVPEKKPIKRRALRKQRPDDSPSDDDEGDTSSSSTCDEGVYDAVAARLVDVTATCNNDSPSVAIRPDRLSCIEEVSRLSNGVDSPDVEEDIVVHFGDDESGDGARSAYGEPEHKIKQPNIPEVVLPHQGNVLPSTENNDAIGSNEKSFNYVDDFKPDKHGPYHPLNGRHTLPNPTDDITDPEMFASTSLNITQTDSCPTNEGRQSTTLTSFVPRVDISQRGIENRSRRARRDFFSGPRSSNAFPMSDTEGLSSHPTSSPTDQPDLLQRSTQRSKSVSRPGENTSASLQTRIGSAGMKETQDNAPGGRMYSRSCSRYRSTDIDAALANTTISRENLEGASFNNDNQKKKMASSLFDLSARRQFSMSNNLQFLNGKSTNSLLETDIDTGEQKNQQIILETDVDTLNTYRLVGGFVPTDQGPIQSNNDKTYSLFNLTHLNSAGQSRRHLAEENKHQSRADAYKRAQSLSGIAKSIDNQRSELKPGASSLVARLRARARSNHELRVAESLTRIHVPEWLDKADLSRPLSPLRTSSPSPPLLPREKNTLPYSGASLPSAAVLQQTLTNGVETRLPKSKTIETVSKPVWSPVPPTKTEIHRPLRPSQILRERNASSGPKLVPIRSSLRGSMKSHVTERNDTSPIDRGGVIRASGSATSSRPVHLTPEDFLTRNEKIWGDRLKPQTPPPMVCTTATSAELIQAPKAPVLSAASSSSSKLPPKIQSRSGQSVRTNGEVPLSEPNDSSSSIKMADSDSIVENQFYQPMETAGIKQPISRFSDEGIYEEVQRPTKFVPPPLSVPRTSPSTSAISTPAATSNPHSPTWHNADSDGETETAATDGLDNISDLTCLTDLLDKYSTRHFTLLQNRPSALENILTQFGWWSSAPNVGSRQQPQGSGDYVALAASRFNPDEDSHRTEFLSLLTSPAGQGPMILTEYGFDQKRIGLDRNPKDGMLYLHCNSPSCPRMGPTRVDRARSWRTCTNCFTAYCSPKCREQALPIHNMVCNFGRVRLVCGRILHHLAPSQQTSLTALAKAGATRLGRGGILITFASVQDAEFFLTRSAELPLRQPRQQPEVVSAGRPSPSGLIAPPIYLTVEELNKLDSKLATPCKLYKPSVSYVLIVIICAYDLEVMKNGRAVHLYKQCIILPFPGTATKVATPPPQIKSPRPKMTTISWTRPQTTKEEREAYSKQLQRTLRERGVSLRHSEPEVYKRLSKFVETGETFEPVEFDFNDYYSNQVITCRIAPMDDVVIRQKKDFDTNVMHEARYAKVYPKKKSYKISRPRIGETEL